jgi:acyl carrier protein
MNGAPPCDEKGRSMNDLLELEIKELIIGALLLEDVRPADIDTDAPLFTEGLGLDSIDALELAIALEHRYEIKIDSDDARIRNLFRSVRTLAAHVAAHRGSEPGAGS